MRRSGALFAVLALSGAAAGCGTMRPSSTVAQGDPLTAPVVVTLGDSVPAGTACDCDPFPVTYARSMHAVSENLAIPGYTSADMLAQIPTVKASLSEADEVVVMIGANDLAAAFDNGTSYADAADTMQQNVTSSIQAIQTIRPTTVLVLGYWNVVEDGKAAEAAYGPTGVKKSLTATDYANSALQAAAKQTKARFISTDAAFHGSDDDQDPTDLLAPDGDHPNAAGHAAIAALLPPLPGAVSAARSGLAAPIPAPTRSGPA